MRLIDADALTALLKRKARSLKVIGGENAALRCFAYCIRRVEDEPTIDATLVVHGKWVVDEFGHKCSACNKYVEDPPEGCVIASAYCLNCGAKMDKEG